jgi:competence protein ComEC
MGAFVADVRCPRIYAGEAPNDGSLFLHLREGAAAADFSGDAPRKTERAEISRADWRAQILKVGHHGSRTATDPEWLAAVKPKIAIVSVGDRNRYGLPNSEVLDLLARDHIACLRTDRDGDIVFHLIDGKFVRVSK